MLVLSRKQSQRIQIGDSVVITVVRIDGNTVRLGIEAPAQTPILREELIPKPAPSPGIRSLRKPVYAGFSENSV